MNKNPEIPDYANNLGLALLEQGQHKEALAVFKKVIALDKDLPQPYMNIASSFERMKNEAKAIEWRRKAIEMGKAGHHWEFLWGNGNRYLKEGKLEWAKEFLEAASQKAARQNIKDPRIFRDLGQLHFMRKEYQEAQKYVHQVEQLGYTLSFETTPNLKRKPKSRMH